jgi:hypothetical protein
MTNDKLQIEHGMRGAVGTGSLYGSVRRLATIAWIFDTQLRTRRSASLPGSANALSCPVEDLAKEEGAQGDCFQTKNEQIGAHFLYQGSQILPLADLFRPTNILPLADLFRPTNILPSADLFRLPVHVFL